MDGGCVPRRAGPAAARLSANQRIRTQSNPIFFQKGLELIGIHRKSSDFILFASGCL
jgi:hypothetical protein